MCVLLLKPAFCHESEVELGSSELKVLDARKETVSLVLAAHAEGGRFKPSETYANVFCRLTQEMHSYVQHVRSD